MARDRSVTRLTAGALRAQGAVFGGRPGKRQRLRRASHAHPHGGHPAAGDARQEELVQLVEGTARARAAAARAQLAAAGGWGMRARASSRLNAEECVHARPAFDPLVI